MEVLSILKHPNIIAYFDNFVEEKSLMIVMEYAPGGTLFEFIQDRNGVLMEEEVSSFFPSSILPHSLSLSVLPPMFFIQLSLPLPSPSPPSPPAYPPVLCAAVGCH